MRVSSGKVTKFLSTKIAQLNDIIADLDGLVTQIGFDFYRVCIFGSARITPDSEDYKRAHDLAYALANHNVDIVTGGGPGLMEAANQGAKAASKDARSIGLPIQLPFETEPNRHLDMRYPHRRFSSRLDEFMRISNAVIVTPGGIGTVLELFFTWQLIVVDHMEPKPIILLGDMWDGLLDWMKTEPLSKKLMDKSDFEHLKIAKSVDEVVALLVPLIDEFQKAHKKE